MQLNPSKSETKLNSYDNESFSLSAELISENPPELDLTNIQIQVLPPEIGRLTNLKKLDLSYTGISELPLELFTLNKLVILDVTGNKITSLSSRIGNLPSLEILMLCKNQLKKLPSEIGNLKKLEVLFARCNQIERLPVEIGKLSSLVMLNLDSNQLTTLPKEISCLTSIQGFCVNNNLLTSFPIEFGDFERYKKLYLNIIEFQYSTTDETPSTHPLIHIHLITCLKGFSDDEVSNIRKICFSLVHGEKNEYKKKVLLHTFVDMINSLDFDRIQTAQDILKQLIGNASNQLKTYEGRCSNRNNRIERRLMLIEKCTYILFMQKFTEMLEEFQTTDDVEIDIKSPEKKKKKKKPRRRRRKKKSNVDQKVNEGAVSEPALKKEEPVVKIEPASEPRVTDTKTKKPSWKEKGKEVLKKVKNNPTAKATMLTAATLLPKTKSPTSTRFSRAYQKLIYMQPKNLKYKKVMKIAADLGYSHVRTRGDHHIMQSTSLDPDNRPRRPSLTIPGHSPLKTGTAHAILDQLKEEAELRMAIESPKKGK